MPLGARSAQRDAEVLARTDAERFEIDHREILAERDNRIRIEDLQREQRMRTALAGDAVTPLAGKQCGAVDVVGVEETRPPVEPRGAPEVRRVQMARLLEDVEARRDQPCDIALGSFRAGGGGFGARGKIAFDGGNGVAEARVGAQRQWEGEETNEDQKGDALHVMRSGGGWASIMRRALCAEWKSADTQLPQARTELADPQRCGCNCPGPPVREHDAPSKGHQRSNHKNQLIFSENPRQAHSHGKCLCLPR